jgi:feruloyl esterase
MQAGRMWAQGCLAAAVGTSLLLGLHGGAEATQGAGGEAACSGLAGRTIDAASIGLPTGGTRIESAVPMAEAPAAVDASDKFIPAMPPFCKVLGAIAPIDLAAPAIRFQINLPVAWNGKAVQYGGGGFNGVLITGLEPLRDVPPDVPPPLMQGYVTLGTDSGHQADTLPEIQAFALNDEALTNFAFASYKKVHDVAVELMRVRYGRAPSRFYYYGGSEGGREGLTMAQRFPADYDGIVSAVPVINWTALQAAGTRNGIVQQNGGWLGPAKVATLGRAVLAACDGLDGLEDGIVSHHEGCAAAFDAKTLRCPDGRDAGDACLSDAQIAAVAAFHAPYRMGVPLANGVAGYPGWGHGGEDQPGGMVQWQTGPQPPAFPLPLPTEQSRGWYYGSGAIRYFIARDPAYDPRSFAPAAFAGRVAEVSALMDSTDPDLSAFLARGGRLILKENMADYAQSPFAGIDYYRAVVARMGQATADRFVRLYLSPGSNHSGSGVRGTDGSPIPQYVDLLGALDAWVEQGQAPGDHLVQTSQAAKPPFAVMSSRPMCRHPNYPRYDGSGDPLVATSYTCTAPAS